MMILTGYIGQYYEVSNPMAFFVWGTISTVFFVHVLILMRRILNDGKAGMAPGAAKLIGTIWTLFLVSWMLYPGAYLMPVFTAMPDGSGTGLIPIFSGETAVVARSITYTIADVSSKIVYGVLLTVAAQIRSKEEHGYDYDALNTVS